MTLADFIAKYKGQVVDTDGYYGGQCMDLMHKYLLDVYGLPLSLFAAPTAYDAYKNANDSRFTKIANSPTGVPQPGDVIFWNTTVGTAGHVAIFKSGNVDSFTSFDQNWPVGSNCHEQTHNYSGVAGWLHYNGTGNAGSDALATCLAQHTELVDKCNEKDKQIADLVTQVTKIQGEKDDLSKQLQNSQIQVQNLREAFDKQTQADSETGAELLAVSHERDSLKATLEATRNALGSPTSDLIDMLASIDSLKSASDDIAKEYATLQKAFEASAIFRRIPKKTLTIWEKIKALFS